MKYLKITFKLLVLLFSGDIKENKEKKSFEKKSSKNDQLTGHFQSFFSLFFFIPPTLNLKKNSCKSTNKKILALLFQLTPWIYIKGNPLLLHNFYTLFEVV